MTKLVGSKHGSHVVDRSLNAGSLLLAQALPLSWPSGADHQPLPG
jgi:hypothetical protein